MKPIKIHKDVKHSKFTSLSNDLVRDKNLSFRARGILGMVFSNCPEWQTTSQWIEEHAPDGREAIRSAMKELERYGYLKYSMAPDARGVMTRSSDWYETPLPEEDRSNFTKWRTDGKAQTGSRGDGKPSPSEDNPPQKDQEKKLLVPSETSDFKLEEPVPKAKTPSLTTQFTKQWNVEYLKTTGSEYKHGGAADGVAVARWIKTEADMMSALNVASQAWGYFKRVGAEKAFYCKQAATIKGFFAKRNEIEFELTDSRRTAGTPALKPGQNIQDTWEAPTGV